MKKQGKTKTLAGCVILDDLGRILLLHRREPHAQWELPGGKIEDGEDAIKTAMREISEELGITVVLERELGSMEFAENGDLHGYMWFLASVTKEVPVINEPKKFDDLKYFFWVDLLAQKSDLSANMRNLLEAYSTGKLRLFPGLDVYCPTPKGYLGKLTK